MYDCLQNDLKTIVRCKIFIDTDGSHSDIETYFDHGCGVYAGSINPMDGG